MVFHFRSLQLFKMATRASSRFSELTHHMSPTLSKIWKRNFVAQISVRQFSQILYDQTNEQSNKEIKFIIGPTDFENPAVDKFQGKWEFTKPKLTEYLKQVESKIFPVI